MLASEKGKELHRLILSLDDRERRLYRRQSGQNLRNGKSNYLDLFNALAAMDMYDEALLKKKLGDANILRHLHTHQSRLFDHLTDFLRDMEELPNVDKQLNAACERVTILMGRGLYMSAKKELKKAQRLALKHDNYIQLLRMADLERSFFFLDTPKNPEPYKEGRKFRDMEFLANLQNQVNMKLTHFEALFMTKAGSSDQGAVAAVSNMVLQCCGSSITKTIKDAKPTTHDLLLLDAIGLVSQLEGNFDKAYLAYSRMDALWVSGSEMISENASFYITFITGFLNSCLVKGRYNEFRSLLANLKTVQFPKESDSLVLHEVLLYLESVYCLNRGEFDKGIALGPDIERLLSKYRSRLPASRIITFYYNLCSLHFMKGQYSKANKWLAQLLNLPYQDYRRNVLQFAPIWQLLLFIAMDDRELLAARMRAQKRARGGEPAAPLEAAIMDFAAHYLRCSKQEVQPAIAQFRQTLLDLISESPVTIMGVGECLFWAEGRLKGKTPGEVFREYSVKQER